MINSILFIPLNKVEYIANANKIDSEFIFDLEDSIFKLDKDTARNNLNKILSTCNLNLCAVRVNSLQTKWWKEDLDYSIQLGIRKIVIPKVNSVNDIKEYLRYIKSITKENIEIIPIIETYLGLCNADEIISNPNINFCIFGSEDFLADIGAFGPRNTTSTNPFLLHAIVKLAIICNKHDKFLIDPVFPYIGIDTIESLKEEILFGLSIGTVGKLAIHPEHVIIINSMYKDHYTTFFHNYFNEVEIIFKKMKLNSEVVTTLNGKLYGLPEIRKYKKIYKKFSKHPTLDFDSELLKIANMLLPYE